MSGRVLRRLPCGMAALLLLWPAAAAAQSAAPDPQTVRIGPFDLKPSFAVTNFGIDDNVFNERLNPRRDFTFIAAPAVEVAIHPGRLRLAYTSGSEFVYFRKYTSERSVNRSFGARADLDLALLRPFVSVTSGHTSTRANAEIDVRARHHPRTYAAGTRLKLASRTEMVFTAREARDEFDDRVFRGIDLARTLNQTVRSYETAVNVALTPFTTAGVGFSRENQRFDRAPLRDSNSWRLAPTLIFSPLGLVNGTASVGYRHFDGLDASLPDYSGLVASGSVGILFVGRYKLDTTFTRDVRYSYEEALPYYLVNATRATLAAQAIGQLELRVLAGRESMDYRVAGMPALPSAQPGRDLVTSYGAGVGYRVGDRARVVVDVERLHRGSTRDLSREYSNHRVMASLVWGAVNR